MYHILDTFTITNFLTLKLLYVVERAHEFYVTNVVNFLHIYIINLNIYTICIYISRFLYMKIFFDQFPYI